MKQQRTEVQIVLNLEKNGRKVLDAFSLVTTFQNFISFHQKQTFKIDQSFALFSREIVYF